MRSTGRSCVPRWMRVAAPLPGVASTHRSAGELAALYDDDGAFRNRVVMETHGFGRGEYRYFCVSAAAHRRDVARSALSRGSRRIANRWNETPEDRNAFSRCACRLPAPTATTPAQTKPTPLLLRYGPGDYNCLHQDLVRRTRLSAAGGDPAVGARRRTFTGGEFVLTEQRPRLPDPRRGRASSGQGRRGGVRGSSSSGAVESRGAYRVNMRHGVSRLHSGRGTRWE